MKIKICIIFFGVLTTNLIFYRSILHAQESPAAGNPNISDNTTFTSQVFLDTYYLHDFNDPPSRKRAYTTQGYYDDEPAVNLGYVDTKYSGDNWHGRLALQGGSSVKSNYAGEPQEFWQYVQEAYSGYKFTDKLWIDGGIYFSHLGPEGWISRDNWAYTRSLISEYSPYYQAGMRATYQVSDKVSAQLHLINGWQNISDNRDPAVGMQLSYQLSSMHTFTFNNFIGNEHGVRLFNDFIYKYEPTDRLGFLAAFDVGSQERSGEQSTAWWYGFSIMSRYKLDSVVSLAARIEQYRDPHQVILASQTANSFAALGFSAGINIELLPKLVWRTEYKVLLDNDQVFPKEDGFSDSNSFIVTSLTYSYDLWQ